MYIKSTATDKIPVHTDTTPSIDGGDIMSVKEELKELAEMNEFQLFGVADLEELEKAEYPDDRGLFKPSEIMHEVRSVIVLGKVLWDEGMNLSVSSAGSGDFSGGSLEYYNFYYNLVETLGWRFCSDISREYGVRAEPSVSIHLKVAASLAGLGFIGHSTLVITPEYGPRVRWVAILTDMDLEPDKPFSRDLCAEQSLCRERERCIRSCPYNAIVPGPSQGVAPGEKLEYDRCAVAHEFDVAPAGEWEKHIRRVTPRGTMECTLCNLSCPYGDRVEKEIIPVKRGL